MILLLAAALSSGDPGRWHWIVTGSNGVDIMVDVSTISDAPPYRRAWSRMFDVKIPGSSMGLDEYDCTRRTTRMVAFRAFSPDGRITNSADYNSFDHPAAAVTPDTLGETMLDFICADDATRTDDEKNITLQRDPREATQVAAKLRAAGVDPWPAAFLASVPEAQEPLYWPNVKTWLTPSRWPMVRRILGMTN